jgi:hypothetical protein
MESLSHQVGFNIFILQEIDRQLSKAIVQFCILTNNAWEYSGCKFLPTFYGSLLDFSHSGACVMFFHYNSNCISFMNNNLSIFCVYVYLAICILSFISYCSNNIPIFKLGCLSLYFNIFYLYILSCIHFEHTLNMHCHIYIIL